MSSVQSGGSLTPRTQEGLNIRLLSSLNRGNLEEAMIHVKNGADPFTVNQSGENIFNLACWKGKRTIVEQFIEDYQSNKLIFPLLLNNPDNNGWTPLMHACRYGHTEIVKMLLAHPEISNSINAANKNGWTPLMIICCNENTEIVRMLLKRLNTDQVNYVKENLISNDITLHRTTHSAFSIALDKNRPETLALLLDHPDIDIGTCATKAKLIDYFGTLTQGIFLVLKDAFEIWATKPLNEHICDFKNVRQDNSKDGASGAKVNKPDYLTIVRNQGIKLCQQINTLRNAGYITPYQSRFLLAELNKVDAVLEKEKNAIAAFSMRFIPREERSGSTLPQVKQLSRDVYKTIYQHLSRKDKANLAMVVGNRPEILPMVRQQQCTQSRNGCCVTM